MENSRHIAVLAFPFGTHAAPLLSLVRRLSAAAPSAVFSFLSTQHSNNSLFRELDDAKVKPFNVSEGLPEGFKGNHHQAVDHFVRASPGIFKAAVEAVAAEVGKPIDCLLTDAFYWFAADIAEELNVPWVAFWTAGPRALTIHCETHTIRRLVGINGPPDKALDFHPEFASLRVANLPDGITTNIDAGMAILLEKMGQAMPRATAILANSYEDLDSTVVDLLKSKFNKFLNIGPFALISNPPMDDAHGCLEWLNKYHQEPASVVYISFGSVITPPPNELAALAEALEECGFPYLWSFRGNPEQQLPRGFIERSTDSKGKIVQWAPQLEVLQHASIGVFVTHGGWNSVLESIIGGVPMICRPFFGDQKLNTPTVESVWGFGLGLEGGTFTKEATTKALKRIMTSEEGKAMREKIRVQKELAFKAVEPDGSSVENFQQLVKIVG